jgi:hypothetical protein
MFRLTPKRSLLAALLSGLGPPPPPPRGCFGKHADNSKKRNARERVLASLRMPDD